MSLVGIDEKGAPFNLPPVQSMLEGLSPKNITIFEGLAYFLCLISAIGIFTRANVKLYVLFYAAARISYDVLLGIILARQSKHRSFTKFISKHTNPRNRSKIPFLRSILFHLMRRGGPKNVTNYPACFQAWLVFKHIENLIMWTDGWSFCVLAIRCTELSRYSGLFNGADGSWFNKKFILDVCLDVFGALLIWVNYKVKIDAHRVQGAYAWFYGDFFFKLNRPLVFDGIYHFVKHPMYTIGYAAYVGLTIISRSKLVCVCAVVGYLLQLSFLFFVEDPHIKRTYGTKGEGKEEKKSKQSKETKKTKSGKAQKESKSTLNTTKS